jgi:alkylation response protein AidB-like acyl-CoA dehydrogenase
MSKLATSQTYDRDRTRSELMTLVDGVRDTLADCAEQAERDGFYPERGWRALHDAGLFRLKSPLELGGFEADPMTQLEVIEEVSRIDTSAGWTLFVGAGTLGNLSGWLPDAGLESFLVDGRLPRVSGAAAPTGKATPVPGGYRVTGRWMFASGSAHAERLSGGAIIEGGHVPPALGFIFQPADVTFHDNWDVYALRGTGSQDISVEDVFVPEEQTFNIFGPAMRGGALYRMGPLGFIEVEHASFALGTGRRALEEMAELAKTKSRGFAAPQGIAARGKFQFDLGHATTKLDAARDHMLAVLEDGWRAAQDGSANTPEIQLHIRCAAVLATEVALEGCRSMFSYAGAHSLFRGNVVERCLRDMQAGAQHLMVTDAAYEAMGQLVMGFDDVHALG